MISASTFKRFKTALFSKNRSAYLGMLIIFLAPITRMVDRVVSKRSPNKDNIGPCLLIVSPPRSGSTIVYQVLTRLLPSVYITNLHTLFPRSASSFLLKRNGFGNNLSGFKNFYGYTGALNDVSEGNMIVSSIFADDPKKEEIRKRFIRFYSDMNATDEMPLIFKNVGNYYQVKRLVEAVPELRIVRIKRELSQIIQSELKAFYDLGYFNPIPARIKSLYRVIEPVEFAVEQILEMERELDDVKGSINNSNYHEIKYETFCEHPIQVSEDIMSNFLGVKNFILRNKDISLKASYSRKVTKEDEIKIENYLSTKKSEGVKTV